MRTPWVTNYCAIYLWGKVHSTSPLQHWVYQTLAIQTEIIDEWWNMNDWNNLYLCSLYYLVQRGTSVCVSIIAVANMAFQENAGNYILMPTFDTCPKQNPLSRQKLSFLNPVIRNHSTMKLFQIVNKAKMLWDSYSKPRGILNVIWIFQSLFLRMNR
jgi:hypothetical protein